MKKLLIIALAIVFLALAFQAAQTAAAAQSDGPILSWLTPENARAAPSAQQFALAARGMDLTGAWDILLFYNDGGKDREIWYLSQQGTTITGHSRYINDRGDFVRNRMTGILNGSYLTMTIKSGLDTVTEFNARIEKNGTTMGTDSASPSGTTFQQTMTSINEGRSISWAEKQDRWINMNGQWWGQKRPLTAMTEDERLYVQSSRYPYYIENTQYPYYYMETTRTTRPHYQYIETTQQAYTPDLDLTGAWDILLFYDDGGVNREIWNITQTGSLLTGHTRYRNDDGDVVRSRLTGRLNGSNITMSLKSGDYTTQFTARISDNGLSMGTKKTAPDGASFNQTMRNIDAGRAAREMASPNRYLNGDWWGHKRVAQTNY